jgi:conjugative transfer region protein TrbK
MRSIAQLGLAAFIGGTMLAIAFVTLRSEAQHEVSAPPSDLPVGHDPLGKELARCATQIPPDASCETVWDAHRHRFWGDQSATNPAVTGAEARP